MIYIIRHGQTERNRRRVLHGRSDFPLNEAGIAQAREAADRLRGLSFDAVYASPLIRAIETAKIVAPDMEPIPDDRLIEMDYGPYEGMGLGELAPEVLTFFSDFVRNPAPPGMEPLGSVVQRAGAFLEDCCKGGGNILVSTHAIAMKGMLEYLTPDSNGSYWSRNIGNCAVFTAEHLPDGTWSIPKEFQGESHA